MAAYFFASPVDVDIRLEGEDDRKKVEIKADKEKMVSSPVYYDGESIAGQVGFANILSPSAWRPLYAQEGLTACDR